VSERHALVLSSNCWRTDAGMLDIGVSCSTGGHMRAWHAQTGLLCRDLKGLSLAPLFTIRRSVDIHPMWVILASGHVGDVYTCKFFPSGQLVLSGGADTVLKIWYQLVFKMLPCVRAF